MPSLQELTSSRVRQLASNRQPATAPVGGHKIHRDNSCRDTSYIETSVGQNRWDEFNLPKWLAPLVQNLGWAKRYASLLNDGSERQLRKLVEVIEATAHTSKIKYLNKSCSHENWESTVQRMNELLATDRLVAEVEQRLDLKATGEKKLAIYAICYRLKSAVLRYAATVQEMLQRRRVKTNAFNFFSWLTSPGALERQRLAATMWPASSAT